MKLAIFALVFAGTCFAQFPVTGRIVDDIDGQPVANARVGLLNEAFEVPPIVRSDADGRFAFSVPAGTYKLAIEKAGFFPYPNDPIEVREGNPGDLALVLTKIRSITARVVWPDGEPAITSLVGVRSISGTRVIGGGEGSPRPDSTGQVYISGLQPGRYIVSINTQQLAALSPGRSGVTTEFPSPEAVERGEVIDLRYTATRELGTITVNEAAGVEVSGRVDVTEKVARIGQPSIDLVPAGGGSAARTSGERDGTFRFPKVPPGSYYLVANTQVPNYVTFGVQEIRVGATPLGGIVAALPDIPPTVTGRIEIETPQGLAGLAQIPVGVRLTRPVTTTAPRPGDANGNFSIALPTGPGGPIPGLRLNLPSGLPLDAYIASVTQGTASYTRDPFPVAVSADPVRVLLKRDGATIRGKVALPGNPARPAYIVLAPKEREASLYYRTVTTNRDGAFQLQAIAPGTYDLFVFDREANYAGEPTLRAYQDAAMYVTVTAGQNLTLNPNVVRIEQ